MIVMLDESFYNVSPRYITTSVMLDDSFYNAPRFKPKYGKTKTGKWVRLYTKSEILGMNLYDMLAEQIREEIDRELISEMKHAILDMKYRSDSIA